MLPLLAAIVFSSCSSDMLEQGSLQKQTGIQEANKEIRQFTLDLNHYFNSYNTKDWDQVVELTYDPVFGGKPRNERIADYVVANMNGMERTISNVKIEKVLKGEEDKDNKYAKIFYSATVSVKLKDSMVEHKEAILTNLELSYDTKEISFNETNNEFIIPAYAYMLAISKKGSNDYWEYIEVDKQKEPYLSQVVPEDLVYLSE